jgi:hypothetical protein
MLFGNVKLQLRVFAGKLERVFATELTPVDLLKTKQ